MKLGDALYNIRTKRKITREALATKAGISQSLIVNMENYNHIPTTPMILKIATALELPALIFFFMSLEEQDYKEQYTDLHSIVKEEIEKLFKQGLL